MEDFLQMGEKNSTAKIATLENAITAGNKRTQRYVRALSMKLWKWEQNEKLRWRMEVSWSRCFDESVEIDSCSNFRSIPFADAKASENILKFSFYCC